MAILLELNEVEAQTLSKLILHSVRAYSDAEICGASEDANFSRPADLEPGEMFTACDLDGIEPLLQKLIKLRA